MPVTVLAGSRDAATPLERVRALADGVPGARFTVLDGPHVLPLGCPDAFGGALAAHLAGVPA